MIRSNSKLVARFSTLAAGVLAAGVLMLAAPDAMATSGTSKERGIVVQYSQEMLNNPADAAWVYGKLKLASRKVCGLASGALSMQERTRASRCYQQTLADVVRKIDRPMLTSVHVSSAGKVG